MAKNIIQDVIAKDKRSIREISINRIKPPAKGENKKIITEDEDNVAKNEIKGEQAQRRKKGKKTDFQKLIIWAMAMFSLGFFLFSLSSYFSTVTVIITPKTAKIEFDDSYAVKKNASSGELQFEVMTLEKKISKQLEATETKNMQVKASGKIIVYNNYNSSSQRFIKNTRFESESGLIYKIPESIIVPGKTVVNGKQIPGSIETVIFADEPGDKYNIKLSEQKNRDFKIAGFKGDKKYDYFYGQIKSDIIGGVSGLVKKVATKTYEDALSELRAGLKSELIKEAFSVKPESSILFENAYFIEFASLPDKALGSNKIEISESATFYGIMFDKAKLSSYLASQKIPNSDGASVDLIFNDDAKITITSNSKIKPWESEILVLDLKGDANVVWTYDKIALQKSLAGYSKSDLNKFKTSHPEFSDARFIVRPFWRRTFPVKPDKIKIVNSATKN